MNNKKRLFIISITLATLCILSVMGLRLTREPHLNCDMAYWPEESVTDDHWIWATTPAGITYNLFLPAALRGDSLELTEKGLPEKSIPMIVCFHGSTGKHTSKDRFGRLFMDESVQARFGKYGIAVLVPQSRVEYFTDTHAYTRLIENICIQHRIIDPARIAGYGFSQGAAFVHEMIGSHPFHFRAVMTGSSYYNSTIRELIYSARVRYYGALAKNDQGIYEQGVRTARVLGVISPQSRYREYEKRGHFYIEMHDTTGRKNETALDWLVRALE